MQLCQTNGPKTKSISGALLKKKLHDEIVRLSKLEAMAANKFGFVQILIREAIDRRNSKKSASPAKKKTNG